jgi:hypothetical protein
MLIEYNYNNHTLSSHCNKHQMLQEYRKQYVPFTNTMHVLDLIHMTKLCFNLYVQVKVSFPCFLVQSIILVISPKWPHVCILIHCTELAKKLRQN